MAGEMVIQKRDLGPRPAHLAGYIPSNADYAKFEVPAGAPIAVLSIDERKWTVKYKPLPNGKQVLERDNVPMPFVDAIIVDVNEHITKAYYIEGFDRKKPAQRPDCASLDGKVPVLGVPHPQSVTCATCKWDQFGTARVGSGKGCQDNKRIAVVPASNPENPLFGGPMLLKLPPTSFVKFAEFIADCKRNHCMPYEVIVRLAFSGEQQYQVVTFEPLQYVSAEAAGIVKKWMTDPHTARILQSLPDDVDAEETTATAYTPSPPAEPVQTRETAAAAEATAERVAATTSVTTDPFASADSSNATSPVSSAPIAVAVPAATVRAPSDTPAKLATTDSVAEKKARLMAELEKKMAEVEALEQVEAGNGPIESSQPKPAVPDTLATAEDVLAMIDAEVDAGVSIPD